MKLATVVVWGLVVVLIGAFCADFAHRVMSHDLVAVSFAEGGDDAYYFFTVARNIAQGHGVTIDGVHWTTGFQPLWGFLCALPFLFHSDRVAFAIIYLASIGLWLASAGLFAGFVRRASAVPLTAPAVALIVVLFLGEVQFSRGFFNGMETGLYLTFTLWLLVAFHDYLALPPDRVTVGRVAGLGVLAGLTMLARNDTLFLCAGLLAMVLFVGERRRPIRDIAVVVVVASVLVLPWLVFCQWVSGYAMPQSGVATAVDIRGRVPLDSIVRKTLLSIDPVGFLKVRTLIDDHLWPVAAATLVAALALVALWRRPRTPVIAPPAGKVLLGLAIAVCCLLLYYPLFSAAGQFFERYFLPLKLLVFILLALLIARALARTEGRAMAGAVVLAVAAATVGSNVYWTARDYHKPWRSHLGMEAYEIVRSPYVTGTSRLGMAESGRLGFLYPTRVVNLDGKMNVEALHALKAGKLESYIASAGLDYLMLHDEDVAFFDKTIPDWRKAWRKKGELGEFDVFEKNP